MRPGSNGSLLRSLCSQALGSLDGFLGSVQRAGPFWSVCHATHFQCRQILDMSQVFRLAAKPFAENPLLCSGISLITFIILVMVAFSRSAAPEGGLRSSGFVIGGGRWEPGRIGNSRTWVCSDSNMVKSMMKLLDKTPLDPQVFGHSQELCSGHCRCTEQILWCLGAEIV